MVLTGRMMDAVAAERCGLISRVIPADDLLKEAIRVARKITELSRPSVILAKSAVNAAFEMSLQAGLVFECLAFHTTSSSLDQKEGLAVFIKKRAPVLKNR